MRTRLKDVAERVQLSPALVSGVLNGRANVWASEHTRARVHEAARQLNYHPSTAAKALSNGRTNTVALVYRRLSGTTYRLAYTGLVDAFSEQLQERGYDLMVSNFATEDEVLSHIRRLANGHACDAVILWGREDDTESQGELLESLKIPFFVKGRHEVRHPEWRQIDFDHEGMMERSVKHLVELGHRRLAYLGFPMHEAFVAALRRGYSEAHVRHLGFEPDELLCGSSPDVLGRNTDIVEEWLSLPEAERPTAFVIGSGNFAWHAVEAGLARRGRSLSFLTAEDGGIAAAGIASYYFTLTFGEALAFQGIEIDNLANEASSSLLDAVLREEEVPNIVRFLPNLTQAPSLGLVAAPGGRT